MAAGERSASFSAAVSPARGQSDAKEEGNGRTHDVLASPPLSHMTDMTMAAAGAADARRGRTGSDVAVDLDGITIEFELAGARTFQAVARADLKVGEREFVAIIGPTGCGKSTLLNAAAGLLVPSAGKVHVSGVPLRGLNRQAGYLFQQDALMPWKTALDNVAIGLEVAGVNSAEAKERARAWLERVGLAAFGERYPHMLSGGQKKRVALAQVLIRDPRIILMDEPFGPLDAQTRLIMGSLLLKLWSADRKAVMFVTHDLEEAIALADRVVVMSAGPSARIIGDFPIPLVRPRDISEIRLDPSFQTLHRDIWHMLKKEVLKAYGETDVGIAT
jgi:NitT/TauT family transport system ATP-binding protein